MQKPPEDDVQHDGEIAPPNTIGASNLLRLVRGLSGLFWGMPIAVILFSHVLRLRLGTWIPVPTFLLGVMIMLAGLLHLRRAHGLTASWHQHVDVAIGILLLQVYFAPFVFWWQRAPSNPYFMANVVAQFFCAVWLLMLLNRLVRDLSLVFRDVLLQAESELCEGAVMLFLPMPPVFVFGYALVLSLMHDSSLYLEIVALQHELPGWLLVFFFFPLSVTMAVCWKAKRLCMARLARRT